MTMVPRCNDNKAKLEDHQISLEGLEVHQTSQGVLRTKLVVHQTNLEVHKDNKVRQEDLQISLEDLEVHQTKLEARRTNLEAHQIKEGLLLKRWIPIQVILTTNQLRQKEKLPRKGNRLQKEKHLRRESRGLQMEQVVTMTRMGAEGPQRWPTPCRMAELIRRRRRQWQQPKPLLRLARCWGRGLEAPSEKASEASFKFSTNQNLPKILASI